MSCLRDSDLHWGPKKRVLDRLRHGPQTEDDKMIDLGTLGGAFAAAFDINP
jgi:hypothetical protein